MQSQCKVEAFLLVGAQTCAFVNLLHEVVDNKFAVHFEYFSVVQLVHYRTIIMVCPRVHFEDNTIRTHVVENRSGAVPFRVFTGLALGAFFNTFVATAEQHGTCYGAI